MQGPIVQPGAPELPPAAPRVRRSPPLATVAWAAALVAVPVLLQFAVVSVPFDADTAYHVAVGRLIRAHGILDAFPWTPFSVLADRYADKELILHLLLAALSGLSWITAAKIAGAALGAVALLAIWRVLRAEGVPLAGLWALMPLAACEVFVFRFSLVRPHLLSIALAVTALHAAARGRLVLLAVASALYPWCYVAWQLPLVLVGVAEVARLLAGERLQWRPAAVALAGIVIGVALHPNAGNLLGFTWVQIGQVLFQNAWGAREGIDLGREFEPFTAGQWARWMLLVVALALAAGALAWRERRRGPVALAFALAALAFGLLTVKTARFAEYFAPFATTAFALAARDVRWRPLPWAVLAAALVYTAPAKLETVRALGATVDLVPPPLAAKLQARIPEGAQVFTCDWGLTGNLMLALPERRFLVALDPTFFLAKDPERYRLWYRLVREGPPGSAATVATAFGARYVACAWDPRFEPFLTRIPFEPGVKTLLMSDPWVVYEVPMP